MASSCKSLLSSSSRFLTPFPSISPFSINANSDSISFSSNFSGGAKLFRKPQSIYPCPNLSPEKYICNCKAKSWDRIWQEEDGKVYIGMTEPNEFVDAETEKFRELLTTEMSQRKDVFGDNFNEKVDVCVEILDDYLRTAYKGPKTLKNYPFVLMAKALEKKGLSRSNTRTLVQGIIKWAKICLSKDWKKWKETHGMANK